MAREVLPYFYDIIRIFSGISGASGPTSAPDFANLDNHTGRLRAGFGFDDGSRLYVYLNVDCSGELIEWDDYGFQYLAADGRLRFRYDNVPHYPDLPTFPHHLHVASGELWATEPPTIHEVARAIAWHLEHHGEPWDPWRS